MATKAADGGRRFGLSASTKRSLMMLLILLAIIGVLFATSSFWVNWWWYDSVGFKSVLTSRYIWRTIFFLIGALLAGGFFLVNARLALKRTRTDGASGRIREATDGLLTLLIMAGTSAIAIFAGWEMSKSWATFRLAMTGGEFGIADPVFGKDAGFYVFTLPAANLLVNGFFLVTLVTLVGVLAIYLVRLGVNFRDVRNFPDQLKAHLFTLLGFLLLAVAAVLVFRSWNLVYSTNGIVFGPGYTDVKIVRWGNWILAGLAIFVALLLILHRVVRKPRLAMAGVAGWVIVALIVGLLLPRVVQRFLVDPSELQREEPYIANNIAMTQAGFDIAGLDPNIISGATPLDAATLSANPETVANIRLWDYRIARTTFQQDESFAPYYVFNDVDVERYQTDAGIQQVLVSARELDTTQLKEQAQTWTNTHLVYTHGYGIVASPVGEATTYGEPVFAVHQIPLTGQGAYLIDRPEIYFGESTNDWVAVRTNQQEFTGRGNDGSGQTEPYAGYEGTPSGSIPMGSFIRRSMTALNLRDRNVFLSSAISDDSIVILHRQVDERVGMVAPWLELDADPYLVVADGRLVWVIDAYTSTDRFPGATRFQGVNYLRPSVKVTVDAYDGTVKLYRTAVPDPIADAYDEVYGGVLTPISEAPAAVAAHFRYPEHYFELQSEAMAAYHVTDPVSFYNAEDIWTVPQEQIGDQTAQLVPYYVTMALPGETEADFTLIRPFIPGGGSNRQNMTAWLSGRSATDGAVDLELYRFPVQETVYGPTQVAARIDQDPEISAQISLWNQGGSEVIRGNLLVLPFGQSVLYVQPLYLSATNSTGATPQLQRVIAVSGDKIVMSETLGGALEALVAGEGGTPASTTESGSSGTTSGESTAPADLQGATVADLAAQADAAFKRGQDALAKGDWVAYGQAQGDLARIIGQLQVAAGQQEEPPTATPEASPTP